MESGQGQKEGYQKKSNRGNRGQKKYRGYRGSNQNYYYNQNYGSRYPSQFQLHIEI